ncbi:MAG: hypothetical protein EDM05_037490 [Leptolyngbya sp. IPPAS B-1204]|uniref:Uncharacterized protein n=1 Tax=Leptolyngbya sp. NK1-12 TaxID=2547451 RepID=A0AA96WF36_9CYAN|nr:hypothetical protein [Leptolyngbya sp. NK1-12]MBF2047737.1 hypothetical protein [Elainella sp. C42_A2020_010]RNJ68928.1 MAG: hypothetical protein EDM05_11920 [Leptolyngbya sp. IPPAS B-1204]WNZ24028.1 hypothetical protein HJG54_14950 [Leptolyngbya sp. NK1-12]
MLTQELDRETEFYLAEILAKENTTSDALIRQLIRDRWLSLHQAAKVASPQPEFQPEASQPNWVTASMSSESQPARPRNSKQVIADFVRRKNRRPV